MWGLQLNLYHRWKWGYKPLKYSSFGSLFKSSYSFQYFRLNYIMFMVLSITLYLRHIQKKNMSLYLYSLPNENCLIILCIKEKLQKDINFLPTWYFISEAKTLTYATIIKVEMSKLHKIKPCLGLWAIKQTKPDFKSC